MKILYLKIISPDIVWRIDRGSGFKNKRRDTISEIVVVLLEKK